jgi:hypothetical protein
VRKKSVCSNAHKNGTDVTQLLAQHGAKEASLCEFLENRVIRSWHIIWLHFITCEQINRTTSLHALNNKRKMQKIRKGQMSSKLGNNGGRDVINTT